MWSCDALLCAACGEIVVPPRDECAACLALPHAQRCEWCPLRRTPRNGAA
jgi:hypothetical protein